MQRKHNLAEGCIDIGDGQAIVTKDNTIEFSECLPVSIQELEFVLTEAKYYIAYRNTRTCLNLFDEFPEILDAPHAPVLPAASPSSTGTMSPFFDASFVNQLMDKLPEPDMVVETSEKSKSDVVLVSTWGIQCGIATYTRFLYDAIKKIDCQFPLSVHNISEGIDDVAGRVVHYQHEYGIIPKIPRSRSKVIVTFHTVPQNIRSTLEAYEKTLDVVAYVAHFQEAYDIISANTEKDVWLIPHGSKIIPGAYDSVQDLLRSWIEIPVDATYAFMFGFQSDNKNYDLVTQACEKAGIKLIISGSVNEHAHAKYKGNIGCNRDNVTVLGRHLSEVEINLYARASDILIFHTNPLDHYSCSGALHRVIGAGRPVICSRVNHYVDMIEDEDCLKYDSEEELVEKIKEALENKEEFGRKALEYAEKTSWEVVARKHIEMYEKYGE